MPPVAPRSGPRTARLPRSATAPLEARLTAAGPHVEAVLDVGTTAGGDLLLVLQEAPVALAELLAGPRRPSAGEAVTVLAPLATALGTMHASGVAHGDPTAAAVRLDRDGAPVWCGFERAVLRRAVGAHAFDVAVSADGAAFGTFAADLVGSTGAAGRAAAAGLAGLRPDRLAEALFDVAEPEPVRLRPEPVDPFGAPARLAPVLRPDGDPVERRDAAGEVQHPPRPTPRARAARAVGAVRALLAPVRPRVWIAAGAAGVLLCVAGVLLPSHRPDADAAPASAPARSATRSPSSEAAPRTLRPAAAAEALVALRARCLAASDRGCLDRVDAAGSPVALSDAVAVRSGTAAASPHGAAVLRWSGGGTALLRFADGSDVLVVREPAGWRLRDVVRPR